MLKISPRRIDKRRKPIAEINVVPYIDVMLVLLVIFMITAPLLNQGIKVNLPKTQQNQVLQKGKQPIIVSINKKGNYFINTSETPEQALNAQQLMKAVDQTFKSNEYTKNEMVFVKGDDDVSYGKVVDAMALIQKAGAERVGLVTRNEVKGK